MSQLTIHSSRKSNELLTNQKPEHFNSDTEAYLYISH